MATPLNLTLKRGPSVWDDRTTSPAIDWRLCGVAAAAMLATLALRPRTSRRWLLGLALGLSTTSLFAQWFSSAIEAGARRLSTGRRALKDQALVDRASEDSFPASDPAQYL
jgi:hypothetical protein